MGPVGGAGSDGGGKAVVADVPVAVAAGVDVPVAVAMAAHRWPVIQRTEGYGSGGYGSGTMHGREYAPATVLEATAAKSRGLGPGGGCGGMWPGDIALVVPVPVDVDVPVLEALALADADVVVVDVGDGAADADVFALAVAVPVAVAAGVDIPVAVAMAAHWWPVTRRTDG